MNKLEAQLKDDYGVTVGSIVGVPVTTSITSFTDDGIYTLQYDETNGCFEIVAAVDKDTVGGVEVADAGTLTNGTAYNLVYNSTTNKLTLTAVVSNGGGGDA